MDFLKNERNVFIAEGDMPKPAPVKSDTAEAKAESDKKSGEEPKGAKPLTAENWEAHQKRFDAHINALPDDVKKNNSAKFTKDLGEIKKQYDSQVDTAEADKKQQLEKKVATELAPQVNDLLKDIRSKITDKAKVTELEKQGEASATVPAQSAESGKDDAKESKEGKKLDKAQLDKATGILIKQFNIQDSEMRAILEKTIPTLNLTTDQIKQMEGNKLDLNQNQIDSVKKALRINEYDKKKGEILYKHLDKILDNYKDAKNEGKPLDKKIKRAISNMFDTDEKPMRQYLVMRRDVSEMEGEGLRINNKPIKELADLTLYLPGDAQKDFQAILNLNGKPAKDQEAALKGKTEGDKKTLGLEEQLWNTAKKSADGLKMTKQLEDSILNSKDSGSQSPMEAFTMLIKLFAAIRNAFKTQDWDTLGDFMQEWNKTKNPKELAKKLNESKEGYDKFLADKKPQDVNQLLSAYLKPRGAEADTLFGKEGATSKFRTNAPDAIKKYMETQLSGLKISSITELPGTGRTEINGSMNGKHMAIEFYSVAGKENQQEAEIKLYDPATDKTPEKKQDKGAVVNDIKAFDKLQKGLVGAVGKPPVVAENSATPPVAPGTQPQTPDQSPPAAPEVNQSDPKKKMLTDIANLKPENLKDFRQILKDKQPALVKEYNAFVKKFQKENGIDRGAKWPEGKQDQCRKAFLDTKVRADDSKAKVLAELLIKREPAKTEAVAATEKPADSTPPAAVEQPAPPVAVEASVPAPKEASSTNTDIKEHIAKSDKWEFKKSEDSDVKEINLNTQNNKELLAKVLKKNGYSPDVNISIVAKRGSLGSNVAIVIDGKRFNSSRQDYDKKDAFQKAFLDTVNKIDKKTA